MKTDEHKAEILDCTLRDGSYANHFQFTALDTKNICAGLEKAGIKRIEVGHGLGLGINSPKLGVAFEDDIDYLEAANEAVNESKIGAFYIPGLGDMKILDNVVDSKLLDFIRIGVNATEINTVQAISEELVSKGIEVHLNLMKTYALPVDDIVTKLEKFSHINLESIYVVDSAGSMLPNEVHEYISGVFNAGWTVGFHGHNNFQLANANCIEAVHAGASYVDGTLTGAGRSAGNAQTEILSLLIRSADSNIDVFSLFELIELHIKPLFSESKGIEIMDIVIAMSKLHSGYLPLFKRVAGKYNINLYRLIQLVTEIDSLNPKEDLIELVAQDLRRTDG